MNLNEDATVSTTETAPAPDNAVTPDAEPKASPKPTTRVYTKEDVDKTASSQFAAGRAAIMKELGFTAEQLKDITAQTAAFRVWQDSQKTEAERAIQREKDLTAQVQQLKQENQAKEQKLAAAAEGIPADKIERYVRLANAAGDDTPFAERLKSTLAEFPLPAKEVPTITKGTAKEGGASDSGLYTLEQMKAMSQEEMLANWTKVQASLKATRKG